MAQGVRRNVVAQAVLVWKLGEVDVDAFVESGSLEDVAACEVMPHNEAVRAAIAAKWEGG